MIDTPTTDTPGIDAWMLPTLGLAAKLAESDFSQASLDAICASLPGPEGEGTAYLALGLASATCRGLLGIIEILATQLGRADSAALAADQRAADFKRLAEQATDLATEAAGR